MNYAAAEKIAKILRTDKQAIYKIGDRLGQITGKKDVFEKIIEENTIEIKKRLELLNLPYASGAKKIYEALIKKIQRDDAALRAYFGHPTCQTQETCDVLLEGAKDLAHEIWTRRWSDSYSRRGG